MASAGRYTYADTRRFERTYSPDNARIFERPGEPRFPVVALRFHRFRRRHSTQSPPNCMRLLHLSQLRRPRTLRLISRHPASRRHSHRRPQLRLNQHPRIIHPKSLAKIVPRAVQARPEARAVLPCRLVDPMATPMTIWTKGSAIKKSITSVKANF